MLTDLVHAFRSVSRAPGYAILLTATLALGIGANSAIFNVAWQVLLRPLPFPGEHRLVMLWEAFGPEREKNTVAPASFFDWQREGQSFEAVAAFNQLRSALNLTGAGDPQELDIIHVTEQYFAVLGLQPIAGRAILPSDAGSDEPLLVLTERLWRRAFGADPSIVGRRVRLHGEPYEVIGVMPDAAALGSTATDGWIRMDLRGERAEERRAHYLQVIARLRPGVTLRQADDDVRRITERAHAQFAAPGVAESARAVALRRELTGDVRPALMVLLAGAGLVLLIACANVSGLQLTRHVRRRRDLAIQASLGASRARQIRLQLAEALILALPAAGAGLILGAWMLVGIAAAAPALIGFGVRTSPGLVVIGYTFALSATAALASIIGSLWRPPSSLSPLLTLRGETGSPATARFRSALVTFQVAVSVLVLVGAALLVSSLLRVLNVDPGYTFDNGLVINLDLPQGAYADASARTAFFERAIERVNALPGVDGACAMTSAPLVQRGGTMTWVPEGETRMVGSYPTTITPECFSVLHIPVIRGRTFSWREQEPVAIVSQSLGRALFGGADPIGRRVHMGVPDGRLLTIVGIVGDIRKMSLESAYGQQMWLPASGSLFPPRQLIVRTSVPPAPLADPIRTAIRAIDPNLPVSHVRTMAGVRGEALADRRFNMLLLLTYGLVGLALSAVGVYGLLSQAVGQRRHEIGLRMALGARPADVVRHVVLGTLGAVLAGCLIGAAGAALLSRFVRTLLFQVSPTEPVVYVAVVALVLGVAALAASVPARRATRIDPLEALRAD